MNMTALTIAQIEEVIRLAEIRTAKDAQAGAEKPGDPSKDHNLELARHHLVTAIEKLSTSAQVELMAFLWLGQGIIGDDLNRWSELVGDAQEELDNDIPEQLASKVKLHEYLGIGLVMIGQGALKY